MAEQENTTRFFTEAPASWNIKYRVNGLEEMLTLRGDSYAAIVADVDRAREYVATHSDKRGELPKVEAPSLPNPMNDGGDDPFSGSDAKPAQASGVSNDNSFTAEKLTGTVAEGKTYWKVKGGRFSQYGVTIWPEALQAAGIDSAKLDPLKEYPQVNGMIAHYELNDKGKPSKVIKLAKPA